MNPKLEAFFGLPERDQVILQFPLLRSPWPLTLIVAAYLLFVLKLGKIFMAHRKPFNLKKIIVVYNIIQVIYNAVNFGFGVYYMILRPAYDNRCIVQLPFDHHQKHIERYLTYGYFLNKLLDLMDTVFYVLRKSYKQITILHIYHHVLMSLPAYWLIKYYGTGGQFATMGFFNSFVHTVMYFYYLISAMYPELKGSIWWKKYITKIQITQFVLLLCQPLYVLIFNPTCKFPLFLQYLQILQAVTMIALFSNFYYHAYIKVKPQRSEKLQKQQ